MADITFPVLPAYNVNPHGINIHCGWRISEACNWVRNNIRSFDRGHFSFLGVPPIATGSLRDWESYVDQVDHLLPQVKLIRPIWNLHCFDSDGNLDPDIADLWTEFVARGYQILLVNFDGTTQRYYNAARGPEKHTEACIKRQVWGWTRMFDWLDANPTVKAAIWGVQPQNEPASFNQIRNGHADYDEGYQAATLAYARVMGEVAEMVADRLSPTARFLVPGWQWDGLITPLHYYRHPELGNRNAFEEIAHRAPGLDLVYSLHGGHLSKDMAATNDQAYFSDGNIITNRRESWDQIVHRYDAPVHQTEVLGLRNNGLADTPTLFPSIPGTVKNRDVEHYLGVGHWWWPYSDNSKARICDLNAEGPLPKALNRFCLAALTALYCYPQNPLWFTGAQYGMKDKDSPDSITREVASVNWSDLENDAGYNHGWGAAIPKPANPTTHTQYFGGTGLCVIDTADGQLNATFGGDGPTVVHCGSTSFDIVYLGRGGGLVRTGGGINHIIGRWGEVTVYAGPGVNNISCWSGKTPWPQVSALHHRTTLVLDPAGKHYVHDWPLNRRNRISFKGAFADLSALIAACALRAPAESEAEDYYSRELVITLPGGGEAVFSHGVDAYARLSASVDFVDGWYGPGWSEPADYDLGDLVPPTDPDWDALYGLGAAGWWRDHRGDPIQIFDHRGEALQMEDAHG